MRVNQSAMLLIAAGLAAPVPARAVDETVWTLRREHAECLLANLAAYSARGDDVVVIFVDACPEADPARAMAQSARNSGALPQAERVDDSSARPARVISYTPAQLACLAGWSLDGDTATVRLPRDPCQ